MLLSQTYTDHTTEFIFLMAVMLLISQLIFVLLDRKKDKKRAPLSNWSTKLIQVFIGLQGFTIFALPWIRFGEAQDLRFVDFIEENYNFDFTNQILIYSSILFFSFSLMISSSLLQILFKVNRKSLSIYLFEMIICCVTLVTGVLLMNFLESNFADVLWPMNIAGSPFLSFEVSVRYGIYLIFLLGTANALFQSVIFFQSTGKKEIKTVKSNPELLDIID